MGQKKKRVLQLTPYFLPSIGGMEYHVFNLSKKLQQKGFDVEVLTNSPGPGLYDGITVHRCRNLLKRKKAGFSPELLYKLLALDYDIVHVHAPFHFGFEFAILFSKLLRKKPVVVTVQMYRARRDLSSRIYDRFVYDKSLKSADEVMATTTGYVKGEKVFEEISDKISIVPNGVDTTLFFPMGNKGALRRELGLKEDDNMMLFVGSLEKNRTYKRPDMLIRILRDLNKKLNIYLVIVGAGEISRELKTLTNTLGLEDRVCFAGRVDDLDLPKYYSAADVFVLPSNKTKEEAFGIVFLESMACGTPVVGSDIPGVREVIGEGGLVFKPGDEKDLIRSILCLLENEVEWKSKSENGRDRVLRNYDYNTIVEKVIEVYEKAL